MTENRYPNAGRELDELVAANVMGWRQCVIPEHGANCSYWWETDGPRHGHTLPSFSTDIAAAWTVVERLQGDGHSYFEIGWEPRGKWDVALRTNRHGSWSAVGGESDGYLGEARAETAPLAICLAALKAVGGVRVGEPYLP